jgi:hypothetical protein
MKKQVLTDTEWAVICTIHIEPKYRFQYEEARWAKRMQEKGLLKFIGDKNYKVTARAERLYDRYNQENFLNISSRATKKAE